ncbi:type VI secretion system protein ImpG [Pseudomonas delhiensis]|uniref:Type VI secretion system protein ImpG n=1 Tax=Pseudomonas delhiensis TaxID=366289 RepID=A0A239ICR5_9PSED|nr:type VI secretion system baseplate subunit TssF [Pseudomonas delhiensis]SDK16404.1 type VI secretion system protein ImpG [Pseudomonas delhiensis]SNS90204.1 type VI secretion system protein ImpG [Pseudomonas delhiensis]
MDGKFLDYYQRELLYLREMGGEFAERHPKIAARLGMSGSEVADPYVERLLEGFAFLCARIQLKMDAEFPRFSQRLLEILHPHYLSPLPSMAIAELRPDIRKGEINGGYRVPRGTAIESDALRRSGTACSYLTAHEVTLQPLALELVELGGLPPDLPLAGLGADAGRCRAALRIRLRTLGQLALKDLRLERLAFHLSAAEVQAQALLELLMQHSVGVVCQGLGEQPRRLLLDADALRHDGFAEDEALLPVDLRNFDGYRLLQEYFAFPARLLFLSIGGLQAFFDGAADLQGQGFELIVLLDRQDTELARHVDASHLALHCTPVINLFPRTAERIVLSERTPEYHLVVDRARPLDHEVFCVRSVHGLSAALDSEQAFRPFYCTYAADHANHGAYFSLRREPRLLAERARRGGAGAQYAGSEVFVSLVDERESPWRGDLKYLSAEVLCSSRDLPLLLRGQDPGRFLVPDAMPVSAVRLLRGPTPPRPALAQDQVAWGLISQLQFSYLSLMDGEHGESALRQLLSLYADLAEPGVARQVQGLTRCRLRPIYRNLAEPGPAAFCRGLAVELMVDEQAFSGASPYLLGAVLDRLFGRLVTLNSFVETRLLGQQRGEIGRWAARRGRRGLL